MNTAEQVAPLKRSPTSGWTRLPIKKIGLPGFSKKIHFILQIIFMRPKLSQLWDECMENIQ